MRFSPLAIGCLLLASLTLLTARSASAAGPADTTAEIALQRALDQPLTLSLETVELAEAFKNIATTAKISLAVDQACYEDLPYGQTIKVSADFRQSKLRDALQEMLLPLGLQMEVSGKQVVIRPSKPLARIGRRAEWEELKLLKELRTSPDIKAPAPPAAFDLITAIRSAMEVRKDLTVTIANGPVNDRALDQIRKQLPMSAFAALEMYCELTNQIWFVEAGPLAGGELGGAIHIMSARQWIQRQMERPIKMNHDLDDLSVVVADLSQQSRITFVPEPGLYQAVPKVSLSSTNSSVQQTLEALAGATRIAFDVRDDSVLLHLAPGPGNQPARSETIVGRITVPVGPEHVMMDVFIRESDLPQDLNDLRVKKVQEAVDGLRNAWMSGEAVPIVPVPTVAPIAPTTAPQTTSAPSTRASAP